jgi:hypothetical protein
VTLMYKIYDVASTGAYWFVRCAHSDDEAAAAVACGPEKHTRASANPFRGRARIAVPYMPAGIALAMSKVAFASNCRNP